MAYYQEDREKRSTDMSSESDSQLAYSTSYACHKVSDYDYMHCQQTLYMHFVPLRYLQGDSFYTLYPDGQYGSAAYMAKAVVNKILQGGLHYDPAKSCCIS